MTRKLHMWQDRASEYDNSGLFHQALAVKLVQLANIQPGQIVLVVATGTGIVAIPAAQIAGEAQRINGIDIHRACRPRKSTLTRLIKHYSTGPQQR